MDFESIFCLQRKNKEGILSKILKKSEEKDKLIMEIQNNAINDDFASLYIVSLNRNIFDQNFTQLVMKQPFTTYFFCRAPCFLFAVFLPRSSATEPALPYSRSWIHPCRIEDSQEFLW